MRIFVLLGLLFALSALGDSLDERIRSAIFDNNIPRLRTLLSGVDLSERGAVYMQDAVFFRRSNTLRVLVENGANLESRDSAGRTPLMDAVEGLDVDMATVRVLVEAGADVNAVALNGGDVLSRASKNGSAALIRYLMDHGAVIRPPECTGGMNPIMAASAGGNLAFLERAVLEVRRFINRRGTNNQTALMLAAKEGKYSTYKFLLQQGADWNLTDEEGNNLLMLAIDGGDIRIVRDLLDKGINVNHLSNHRNNPLSRAIWKNNPAIIKLLMQKGADASIPTGPFGKLPIVDAMGSFTRKAFDELVKYLNQDQLWQGFEAVTTGVFRERHNWDELVKRIDATPERRNRIMSEAGGFGDVKTIKKLKALGVDLNVTDGRTGETALMKAMKREQNQVGQYLLQNGASFDGRNVEGDNALLIAAASGNAAGARMLVRAGMDVDVHDMNGNTPLIRAVVKGDSRTVQTLMQVGASLSSPGRAGQTALYHALANKRVDVARALLEACAPLTGIDSGNTAPEELANRGTFGRSESATLLRLLQQRRNNPRCH
ncbi:MAG: ankyrin repeat domain-containing protein [Bdellovibrio sp.]|nr:ankyrin repeat domain-containing protein [Bdellovibrio sp.]